MRSISKEDHANEISRRGRHTRWQRNWSSDVCSSDLSRLSKRSPPPTARAATGRARSAAETTTNRSAPNRVVARRSEERRVGKEGSLEGSSFTITEEEKRMK